jgi:hypothetical protein
MITVETVRIAVREECQEEFKYAYTNIEVYIQSVSETKNP